MKRWLAVILSLVMMFNVPFVKAETAEIEDEIPDFLLQAEPEFESMDDPDFLQYIEDSVYAELEAEFASEEGIYEIEEVSVDFISQEYLEEIAFNTKANIFFGYTLAEINEVFQGEKYVFTLDDSGETVVQEYLEIPNDTYNRIVKNVLVGTGIILVCVTVSVLSSGTAAPEAVATSATKLHLIFTAAAKSAKIMAKNCAVFTGASTLVTRGFETGWDKDAMIESAALATSEGFKWGAISGAVLGGSKEFIRIKKIQSKKKITWREAEKMAERKYGGEEQKSYIDGKEVPKGTPGSVRPDIVVRNGDLFEAIEVKYYNLRSPKSLNSLRDTLSEQIAKRAQNLPEGMTQRIVLNVEGRGYTTEYVEKVAQWLQKSLSSTYPDIPIDVIGGMI